MKYKAHSLIKLLGFLLTASYAGTVFADEDEHKIKQSFRNLSSHQQLTWYLKKNIKMVS